MTTPELLFDDDGFLDLSVFPEVEPDVFGHGPGALDPALDVDRRSLDDSFDDRWIAAALDAVAAPPASTDDALLLALVPVPRPDAEHPAVVAGDGADEHDDDDEIAIAPLTGSVEHPREDRDGSAS